MRVGPDEMGRVIGKRGRVANTIRTVVRAAAVRFPEACDAEARMLAKALGATVERQACIAGGCLTCEYRVRFADGSVNGRSSRWMDEESA